jgi:hypothetical protein
LRNVASSGYKYCPRAEAKARHRCRALAWRDHRGSVRVINNTSLQYWQRAASKGLDPQFVNEVIQGMNCSPFEAKAILEKVHEVFDPLFSSADNLAPGQIRLSVVDSGVAPNVPLSQARQRLVTLTLHLPEEDLRVRREGGVIALRRRRMVRMCEETFQQGGLLTLEDLANLFNCAVRTLVTDLAALRREGATLPLRSTVKDMGRAITHRRQIVELWMQGFEYSEIALKTCHSVQSVANYVEKFKRCASLVAGGFDLHTVAFVARLSTALAQAFHEIYLNSQPAPHRRQELNDFLKKNNPFPTPEVSFP